MSPTKSFGIWRTVSILLNLTLVIANAMPKIPHEVGGFVALPVVLRQSLIEKDAEHYLYLKAHEPHIPDESAARSLFVVNIPVVTTEHHLRHLFAAQLEAGRVDTVEFLREHEGTSRTTNGPASGKKRKRQTADEIEAALEVYHLPSTFSSPIFVSGSSAIVSFVDRTSMESSLKAARRAAKSSASIVWGAGLETKLPVDMTGLERYEAHKQRQFPTRSALLKIVDNYMTGYAALESARSAENARKRAVPDNDGFITVTRGNKGVVLNTEESEDLKAKQKSKEKGLEDFYRFQMREKRKEQAGEFLQKFEEDKRKIAEMRRLRGFVKPNS